MVSFTVSGKCFRHSPSQRAYVKHAQRSRRTIPAIHSVPPANSTISHPTVHAEQTVPHEELLERAALNGKNLNKKVLNSQYAVRGAIVQRAQQIQRDLESGKGNYPFSKVVCCNIGNPQILGQQPVSYFRQVLSLCEYPALLDHPEVHNLYPSDVIDRARYLLKLIPGGIGAYSESPGIMVIRKMVAESIEERDGYPCDPEDIFMTDGASPGVHYLMELLIRDDRDAFLVPIPQYPLYSATLTLYGGRLVPYMLDEPAGWQLDLGELRRQLVKARREGLSVRGLVVINPGNPTGQCLSRENMEDVIRFCAQEGLVLVADEVYQANIYIEHKTFYSFKKVVRDLNADVALLSLHSISKGFVGECGRRGGYMEIVGFPDAVREQILKLASINLCPNVSGQICTALMMKPPQEGEPSYALYVQERDSTLGSLKRRAAMLVGKLNELEGVTCNPAEGALYAFPRITLPNGAVEAAHAKGVQPDFLYCSDLLESTGILVVPGSGFGQADGTYHFRTTFLPSEEDLARVADRLSEFHDNFLKRYGGIAGALN